MSILTNTPVSWVDVRVNIDVMEKILATAERSAQEELQIERALKLGATTTMIQSFFRSVAGGHRHQALDPGDPPAPRSLAAT
ncbi:DUF2857 domain-containing protein [Pseudomonas aeruginosa]|nr:DUF2857 domain-containing protein [Pseudomonas aeruginosa]